MRPLTASVMAATSPEIRDELRVYARDPLEFAWPALSTRAKTAIIASSTKGHKTLREVALTAMDTYVRSLQVTSATRCLVEAIATTRAQEPLSLPMFVELSMCERAAFDVIARASLTKHADFGTRLHTAMGTLESLDGSVHAHVTDALKPLTWSRAKRAVITEVPQINEALGVSDDVRALLLATGDIGSGMLSLSDDEAATVILSRPVIDRDRQKFIESGLTAFQDAIVAFPFPELQEFAGKSVQVLMVSDPMSSVTRARSRPYDPMSPTVDEDLKELNDLDGVATVLSTVLTKSSMGEDVRSVVIAALASLTSTRGRVFVSRFLRSLRSQYGSDFIVSALMPHNVQVNTEAVDIVRVQEFLSQRNLGALATSFSHYHRLDTAWENMPVRGYLEMLRWPPYQEFAATLPGEPANRVRKLIVRVLARVNAQLLSEIMVAPTGTSTGTLVEHLLQTPMITEFGMADFLSRDQDGRDFARKLVALANTARSEPEVTDFFIVSLSDILNSPYGAEALPAIRKLCDALFPAQAAVAAVTSQILA